MIPDAPHATWRKSTRSNGAGGNCVEVARLTANIGSGAQWRKSTHSGGNGECVELTVLDMNIGIRDSKAPDAGHLTLAPQVWAALAGRIRDGQYDR